MEEPLSPHYSARRSQLRARIHSSGAPELLQPQGDCSGSLRRNHKVVVDHFSEEVILHKRSHLLCLDNRKHRSLLKQQEGSSEVGVHHHSHQQAEEGSSVEEDKRCPQQVVEGSSEEEDNRSRLLSKLNRLEEDYSEKQQHQASLVASNHRPSSQQLEGL